jgi:hypothetical protein
MRQLFAHLFTLVLMLCARHQAAAQAAFDPASSVNTFTVGNASVYSVNFGQPGLTVPTTGGTYNWSAYISKPTSDSQTQGQIAIYAGDNSGNLASSPVSSNSQTVLWNPSAVNGRYYVTVQGTCALNSTNLNGYTKLYAVFIPSSGSLSMNRVVSTGLPVSISTPPSSPPTISSLSPATGPTTTPFDIAGNITGTVTQVSFNGTNIGTSLSATVPTGLSPGNYPVTVTTSNGTSNTLYFAVTASATTSPSISLSPTSGMPGTNITISATQSWYAYSNITVTFNGVSIPYTRVPNVNSIVITVPRNASIGAGTIVVTTTSGSASAGFNVTAPPAPVITSVWGGGDDRRSVVGRSEGSRVIIVGTNLTNVNSVTINNIACTFREIGNATEVYVQVPNGSYIGNTTGTLELATNQGAIRFPFTVLPQQIPANTPSTVPYSYIRTGNVVYLDTDVDWANYLARGYAMPVITFNGVPGTDVSIYVRSAALNDVRNNGYLYVTVPQGVTRGLMNVITQFGTGSGVAYTLAPIQPYIPCGDGTPICSDQHVTFGSLPGIINGRVLADDNSTDFRIYNSEANNRPFAQAYEREWVQWQYSYTSDPNDWHDINGNATSSSFQPWACYATTYYRRVSSHIRYSFPTNYRENWYTSDPVKIIPYTTINPGVYKIRNRYTGQLLEIGGGGSVTINQGTLANQWPDAGTANQQWEITPTADGMYKIINRNSRQALEIGGGNEPQPAGSKANQWPYWGGLKQQWMFVPNGNYFTITSANSGQALEIPNGSTQQGATAGQWYSNIGTNWSQWELMPVNVTSSNRFTGVCTIRNVQSGKALEIGGAATNAGALANQWDYVNLASQEWTIEEESPGTGLYKIRNRNSGLILDIPGSALNDGVQAQQWTEASPASMNQLWMIFETTPDNFVIANYNTIWSGNGKILGVDLANINDYGAPIKQQNYTGGSNQQWIITLVSQNRTVGGTKSNATLASGSAEKLRNDTRLFLYPNPTSSVLNVALSSNTRASSIKVSDLRGATLVEVYNSEKGQLDVSSLAPGTYMVTVRDDQREYHQKFVKQ